jgi:serine protease Do
LGFAKELEEAAAAVREKALPAVVGVGNRWPSGSGIVFGEGLVLTSAHNVQSENPQVHFADGSRREATSVTADYAGDLAVIKISTEGSAVMKWAAGGPELGTPIFAAANPAGRGVRLSFGVVSAQDRDFRGPGGHPITGGFEHTAPLPHGSSGGPVLTLAGELLGVNTKRLGDGLYAALQADSMLRSRLVARRLRAAVGLPDRLGVLVQHLDEEGPAAQSGVVKGDLLTKANGAELSRVSDLHRALASAKPGDQIQLDLVRGVEEKQIAVTLGTEPERADRETHSRRYRHRR